MLTPFHCEERQGKGKQKERKRTKYFLLSHRRSSVELVTNFKMCKKELLTFLDCFSLCSLVPTHTKGLYHLPWPSNLSAESRAAPWAVSRWGAAAPCFPQAMVWDEDAAALLKAATAMANVTCSITELCGAVFAFMLNIGNYAISRQLPCHNQGSNADKTGFK